MIECVCCVLTLYSYDIYYTCIISTRIPTDVIHIYVRNKLTSTRFDFLNNLATATRLEYLTIHPSLKALMFSEVLSIKIQTIYADTEN